MRQSLTSPGGGRVKVPVVADAMGSVWGYSEAAFGSMALWLVWVNTGCASRVYGLDRPSCFPADRAEAEPFPLVSP